MSNLSKYYQILGVGSRAPKSVVKKAYWKLAKKYHPDVNPSRQANQKFLEITTAYEAIVEGKVPQEKTAPSGFQAPQDPFEKYKDVYQPPKDPAEHAEWIKVAKKRAEDISGKQYRVLQGYIRYLSGVRKMFFYPSIVTALLAISFIIDHALTLKEGVSTVTEVSSRGTVYLENGLSFRGGREASYVSKGDFCYIEHSPIYGVVDVFGFQFDDNISTYQLQETFYLWNGFYNYLLLIFSTIIIVRKRFMTGNFFGLYFIVLFWGIVQWWWY